MNVTYIGALIAGLLSFLSPCVLPLVPPYLCFLGGTTFDQLTGEDETPEPRLHDRRAVVGRLRARLHHGVRHSRRHRDRRGPAASWPICRCSARSPASIIIIAGLHFLGVIHLPFLHREARYHADARPAGLIGAYVIGLAFAFGWTPCIGPVLGAILAIAAGEDSVSKG